MIKVNNVMGGTASEFFAKRIEETKKQIKTASKEDKKELRTKLKILKTLYNNEK